jgi:hypothetical protein
MSIAPAHAAEQQALLAAKNRWKCGQRPSNKTHVGKRWLACSPRLGAFVAQTELGGVANKVGFE